MSARIRDNFSDRILAVVQTSGPSHRLLAVSVEGDQLTLLEASVAEGPVESAIEALWSRVGRGQVLRIVPGPQSVCRTGAVAAGSEGETLAAVALVGEALLPSEVPVHRRAAGVLPINAPAGSESRVLATAWIGQPDPSEMPPPVKFSRRSAWAVHHWITQVGALAGIITGEGVAAWVDPQSHSIAIVANGPERAAARQLLGESSTSEAWKSSIATAAQETASAAGIEESRMSDVRHAGEAVGLIASPNLRAQLRAAVRGAPTADEWIDQYGLCVAAALVATGPSTLRPLAGLTAHAPRLREPLPLRAAQSLATGSRARYIIAAGVAILLLGPVGFAFARHSVLKSKISRLDEQKTSREETIRRAALYSQLEVSRWPVTKLLSDVSIATPVGVSAETVSISTELGLKLAGRADSQALVNMLQANLNATKLFRNVKVGRTESLENGKVGFDISAEVASPHNKVTGMEDFAKQNLAERLYGAGADNLKEAPLAAASNSRRATRAERGDDSGKEGSGSSRRTAEEGPPAALTDADIAKMDSNTAMREWAKRKSYVQKNPALDTENKDRLNSEAAKLREQMKKGQSSTPATGAPK